MSVSLLKHRNKGQNKPNNAIIDSGMILHRGNRGNRLHAHWSPPWCPLSHSLDQGHTELPVHKEYII